MPKELRRFYVDLLSVPLFIMWQQFINFKDTPPIPSHWVPSIFFSFQKVTSQTHEHCDFVDPQGRSWILT